MPSNGTSRFQALEKLSEAYDEVTDTLGRQARSLVRDSLEPLYRRILGMGHGLDYVRHMLRGNKVARESLVAPSATARPPILLLHGFLGTRGAMAVLEGRLRDDNHTVFSFNLGTLNIWDIRRSAFLMHRKLEGLATQVGVQRFDVVAHSMGGLIALYYVKRLGGAKRIRKLIMLGTPHRGTWGALLGVATMGVISSSTWQLLPESLFLRDLAEGPLPPGVEYTSIWAEFDWLCPPSSARLPGAREILCAARPLVAGHEPDGLPAVPVVAGASVQVAPSPRRPAGTWLVFVTALVVYTATWAIGRPVPTGDEGHYLLIASSIARDGDVDLTNDYAGDDLARLDPRLGPLTPGTHAHRYWPGGPLLSTHGVGLGFLLAPIIRLGGGLTAIRLFLIVIAAALAAEVWALLAIMSRARPLVRGLAWSLTFLTLPLVVYANQIYAEVPSAFLIAVALRRLVDRWGSYGDLFVAGLAIALLPWVHLRFAAVTVLLGFALLVRASLRGGSLLVVITCAIPVASVVTMLGHFHGWYGSAWPGAIRGPVFPASTESTLHLFYDNVLSALLSPATGWLPFAPAHLIGLVGFVMLVCWKEPTARWACLALASYALTLSSDDSYANGWSYPARMLVAIVPFVALPLATALRARPALRLAFVPLAVLSIVITAAAIQDQGRLYPLGTEETDVPVARELAPLWPRFPWGVGALSVAPDTVSRSTGHLVPGTPAVARAVPGEDPPGTLSDGPYTPLLDGEYRAMFDVAIAPSSAPPDAVVARLDVASRQGAAIHAAKELHAADAAPDGGFARVELPFTMPAARNVLTRVVFTGVSEVRVAGIRIDPVAPNARTRDWDRALLWIGGIVAVGLHFARRARYRP